MMILLTLLVPIAGAIAAARAGKRAPQVGLIALGAAFVILLDAWLRQPGGGPWAAEFDAVWIAPLGVHFRLALDGLSFALAVLTLGLGAAGLYIARGEITARIGAFTALYLLALTGILGVFLAQDLFLFFVFYEIMLVPAYFLLTLWGDDKQGRAATTFFIFTQTSGLALLVSILGLVLIHARGAEMTFDPALLAGTADGTLAGAVILFGFFIAFAVKLPVVPFHTWQAPAYAAAPASVGILLAGLMSKAGAYGLIRFAAPLLPQSTAQYAPAAMTLACVSLVYCAVLALGQKDLKRLIAYSSAGHLAFVVLGVAAQNELGHAGAVATMLAHALSVSGLFIIAGYLERATGTRDLDALGGLWTRAPRTGALAIVLTMATLGLPGLGNFIGEFLTLLGVFKVLPAAAMVGAAGAVLGAIYALVMLQRAFLGPVAERARAAGEAPREALVVLAILVAALLWLGVRPQAALDLTAPGAGAHAAQAEGGAPVDHS
jgi:NADH-quinone oxidoreductase subunit M